MKISFQINGSPQTVETDGDTPLLWVIRDILDLKGTKFGCGKAACGACTIHVEGLQIRSCSFPAKLAQGKEITTIEGLSNGDQLHPVQQAWIEEVVPQCGYCQSGQIMQAADLLSRNPSPDDAAINAGMDGNLCRCMAYKRIKSAIKAAANAKGEAE